jgi:hypothetical protein
VHLNYSSAALDGAVLASICMRLHICPVLDQFRLYYFHYCPERTVAMSAGPDVRLGSSACYQCVGLYYAGVRRGLVLSPLYGHIVKHGMWEEIGVSEILNAFVHCVFAEISIHQAVAKALSHCGQLNMLSSCLTA